MIAKAVLGLLDAGVAAGRDRAGRASSSAAANREAGWGAGLTVLTAMANVLADLDAGRPGPRPRPRTGLRVARHPRPRAPVPARCRSTATCPPTGWPRGTAASSTPARPTPPSGRSPRPSPRGEPTSVAADLMFAAVTDHVFLDGGHTIDFTNKAFEAVDHLGWDDAAGRCCPPWWPRPLAALASRGAGRRGAIPTTSAALLGHGRRPRCPIAWPAAARRARRRADRRRPRLALVGPGRGSRTRSSPPSTTRSTTAPRPRSWVGPSPTPPPCASPASTPRTTTATGTRCTTRSPPPTPCTRRSCRARPPSSCVASTTAPCASTSTGSSTSPPPACRRRAPDGRPAGRLTWPVCRPAGTGKAGWTRPGASSTATSRGGGDPAAAIAALGRALLAEDAELPLVPDLRGGRRPVPRLAAGLRGGGAHPGRRRPVPGRPHPDPPRASAGGADRHPAAPRRGAVRGELTVSWPDEHEPGDPDGRSRHAVADARSLPVLRPPPRRLSRRQRAPRPGRPARRP